MGTAGSLYDNIYTSKVYEGNKLWANIKRIGIRTISCSWRKK